MTRRYATGYTYGAQFPMLYTFCVGSWPGHSVRHRTATSHQPSRAQHHLSVIATHDSQSNPPSAKRHHQLTASPVCIVATGAATGHVICVTSQRPAVRPGMTSSLHNAPSFSLSVPAAATYTRTRADRHTDTPTAAAGAANKVYSKI